MANLLASLLSSAHALSVYDQVLAVTQNNVANASTPGYAAQTLPLEAMELDLSTGASGGVTTGQLQSARNEYAEQAVREQNSALGQQQQAVNSFSSLQSLFDISGNIGMPYALNQFFQSVSAWGQDPSNQAARQTVLSNAAAVAQSFQSAAHGLQNLAHDTETQIHSTVDQVNSLVGQVETFNHQILETGSGGNDPGMDAQIHATLENLSQYISFSAIKQDDGTTSISVNGTTPLLVGDHQYTISAGLAPANDSGTYPNAPAVMQLRTSAGADITNATTDGQLGALMNMRNVVLPSYLGDNNQAGDLNQMAKAFADRVNQLLTAGNISDGPPPQPGVPLFQYDTTNDTNVAATLTVDPTVTPDQLAVSTPGPPYVSNGVPLGLSNLATPSTPADEIDGVSFTQFYGNMAADIGRQLQQAQGGQRVQQSLVAQAQNQRQQFSGVDLNEEAMIVVEFQRAYEANSRLITVLDQLTEDTINILQ